MKREEVLSLCALNPEVIATYIESLESQIKEFTEKLVLSKSCLNQNSRNSSKPPSTDYSSKGKPNPKSLRKKSGKKPGGQEGHSGRTLEKVDNPDQVIEYSLNCCEECGHNFSSIEVEAYEKRRVFDISPVNLIAKEHRSQIKTLLVVED